MRLPTISPFLDSLHHLRGSRANDMLRLALNTAAAEPQEELNQLIINH